VTLVQLGAVGVQYGANVLLRDVTCTVAAGERWGIIGRNGSGKTSLFRIIAGLQDPSQGVVSRLPGLRVALLDQHRDFPGATTVWQAASAPFAELLALEHSLAAQGDALGAAGDKATPAQLERYGRDLEHFQREGGYAIRARVAAVLHGLGFDPEAAPTQLLETLSGGERGRLGLACQLVTPADLLLLDEPTNHLDLETTAWLTAHLRGLEAGMLLISHDRAFLDSVADHILHIEAGSTQTYTGGYSAFVTQRAERRLSGQRAYEKQAKVIAAEEDYIRRNIAGQDTKQAKGRRRKLMRLPRLSPPPGQGDAMAVRFRPGDRGGDQVLVLEDLSVAVEGRVLVAPVRQVLRRGDVVGLVGPNGAGKSTLLNTLLGTWPPASGSARLGLSTTLASYRQDFAQVPRDKTLFDIIHDLRPTWTRGQVMDQLGRFDFSADRSLRRADSLSGGELARVALAMMTLVPVNFLVFDEPTNHLDVESIEALEDAIEDYEGTVLLVSHDRALLDTLCTRIWALEDGVLHDFDGGFEEWFAARAARRAAAASAARKVETQRREKERDREKRGTPDSHAGRKAQQSADRSARRTLEQAEAQVHQLEQRVHKLGAELADPHLYDAPDGVARAERLSAELERLRTELDGAYVGWTDAAEAVEKLGPE